MAHRTTHRRRRRVAIALSLTAAATLVAAQAAQAAPAPPAPTAAAAVPARPHYKIQRAPVDRLPAATLQRLATARLANPTRAKSPRTVNAAKQPVDPIDMRVLVLATTGDPNPNGVNAVPAGSWDWDLSTLTSALDYIGVPYDVYKSTTKQLCVNGSWKIDYVTSSTASTCSSGKTQDWSGGTTPGITQDKLQQSAAHAYYQGVMQTNGTLSYVDAGGAFVSSALSATEWSTLWTFEAAFGIRTVSANTYPTADFGLTYAGEDGTSITAKYTAAATAATGPFPYVNGAGTLPIASAWRYRATISDPATTTAMITDSALTTGNALGVIHTYPNQGNRQTLALMFDSAGYLTHGQALGYGLVNWVTNGLFLGERHAYLDPQPDDIFISDSTWQPTTPCGTAPDDPSLPEYRITGSDFTALTTWQTSKQQQAISKALTLELPFNGEGTTAAYNSPNPDTLTPVAKANQAKYKWINHTYSHLNLDSDSVPDAQVATTNGVSTLTSASVNLVNAWDKAVTGTGIPAGTTVASVTNFHTVVLSQPATVTGAVPDAVIGTTAAQATQQITQNNQVATQLGLTRYNTANLIQPDISGLANPGFLQAAHATGLKYLIYDTSRTPSNGVNEGLYNSIDPSILELARYPVNLYFNVSTPAQWLAEDNCLYPAGAFGHVSTYAQLLDRESNVMLRYLLQGHNRPLMFHEPNLRAYSSGHSLLGDLIDATLAKYSNLVTVPLTSPTQDVLGQKQASRMAYDAAFKSGLVSASIVPNTSVVLTAASGLQGTVTIPVTGAKATTASAPVTKEQYAGQPITYVTLSAGQSVTLSLS